jgi:hypothetical protein
MPNTVRNAEQPYQLFKKRDGNVGWSNGARNLGEVSKKDALASTKEAPSSVSS